MQLTQSQFSLWMGQKLNPNVPLYNMAHVFTIHGPIHEANFKNAFQQVIEHSDAIRTVFDEENNIPFQKVLSSIEYDMECLDFSKHTDIEIQDWLKQRSQQNFDVAQILFDSVLLKLSDEKYKWFLNIHHLITDATSSTLLYELMCRLYSNLNSAEKETLDTIPTFASYVNYEANNRLSEKSKETKSYWKEKLVGLKTPISLYGRKGNLNITKSHRIQLNLGQERLDTLQEIAQLPHVRSWSKDLTMFNIFSTVLGVFIKRISGENKIVIGTPSHNRLTKTFKKTPGLFVEFFPLVADIENEHTFESVLSHFKLETNNYLRYAQPGMSTPALNNSYNVILNYINASFSNFNGLPMESEWLHPDHCDSNHYIRCHVYDMDKSGNLSVFLDLNEAIFNDELRANITSHFLAVFDAFLENIKQPIGGFSLIDQQKISSYRKEYVTPEENEYSVIKSFESMVKQVPNAVALQYQEETLTYHGLNKRANQLANYLKKQGVQPQDKIALYNYRNSDYMISVLAVMKLGAVFIPIASNQPADRLSFILSNANSSLVLTHSDLKKNLIDTNVKIVDLSYTEALLQAESSENLTINQDLDTLAYVLYTSGSTGNPKGVLISNKALANYINWGKDYYDISSKSSFALFTSIGFDLTITSTFLPLVSGGRIIIYKESSFGPDTAVLDVINDNLVDTIKLTPSHLSIFKDKDVTDSSIEKIIVGGEDFKESLGKSVYKSFGNRVRIFNEYGPTEATVGCIVTEYNPDIHKEGSVPIGKPISNMHAYILDDYKNQVPDGVMGDLYLSGAGLADGYLNSKELTEEKFVDNPFVQGEKMYETGDLARINEHHEFEYLGRVDEQVKLRGYRIELTEIESNLNAVSGIENCAIVVAKSNRVNVAESDVVNCVECGLPSNYPNTDFDDEGVCHLCNAFKGYKEKANKYFKTETELKSILTSNMANTKSYDCLSLLSGGKDSTYILAQLVGMGLKVLAFTLDNGYISDQAKGNINRIVKKLGVDHVYGTSNHMDEIFVDSLKRHQNVCNGCFKTIYTLSTQIAMEKEIPFIVTGLSRGQFFETRLTEELFWDENLDVTKIDDTILEVRKLYHREEDAVKELLDVSLFENDEVFQKVQFIDFYRYSDVSLEDMLIYLDEKVHWVRPTDTGRSTNCLINQVGIYVHKKEKGYSNYSFPYSWDVRLGHKTRDESLEEINEYIDEVEVKRIMEEIGYQETDTFETDEKLVAYYTGDASISVKELKQQLSKKLPDYMMPSSFRYLEVMPLTKNGKVDKNTLKNLNTEQLDLETSYVAPRNEIDELIEQVWKDVLRLNKIGIKDNFIALGGHSLAAIRVTSRINDELGLKISLNKVFNLPTIEDYSNYLENLMVELLNE